MVPLGQILNLDKSNAKQILRKDLSDYAKKSSRGQSQPDIPTAPAACHNKPVGSSGRKKAKSPSHREEEMLAFGNLNFHDALRYPRSPVIPFATFRLN